MPLIIIKTVCSGLAEDELDIKKGKSLLTDTKDILLQKYLLEEVTKQIENHQKNYCYMLK
jgi:hypothetical protein